MNALFRSGLLVGGLVVASLPSSAVELKLKWEPGKRYVFEHASDYSAKMPLPGQPGLIETKGKMSMTMNHDAAAHEKGVKVGVAFSAISMRSEMQGLVMEFDSEDPAKSGGLLGSVLKPLTKVNYESIYSKDGELLEMKGLDDLQAAAQMGLGKAEIEAMGEQAAAFLPKKEVNPGDTWESEVELPMGALGGELALNYSFKLEEIMEKEGRSIAKVSITGKMKDEVKADGEAVLDVEAKEVSGQMLFDIALGQPMEVRTSVELEMAVPAGIPTEEGAPGRMPMKTITVQRLLQVEEIAPAGRQGAAKKKPSARAGQDLTPEEKKARRKARRDKRKAEKAAGEKVQ